MLLEQEVQLSRLRASDDSALTNFNPNYGCDGILNGGNVDVKSLPQVARESLRLVKWVLRLRHMEMEMWRHKIFFSPFTEHSVKVHLVKSIKAYIGIAMVTPLRCQLLSKPYLNSPQDRLNPTSSWKLRLWPSSIIQISSTWLAFASIDIHDLLSWNSWLVVTSRTSSAKDAISPNVRHH